MLQVQNTSRAGGELPTLHLFMSLHWIPSSHATLKKKVQKSYGWISSQNFHAGDLSRYVSSTALSATFGYLLHFLVVGIQIKMCHLTNQVDNWLMLIHVCVSFLAPRVCFLHGMWSMATWTHAPSASAGQTCGASDGRTTTPLLQKAPCLLLSLDKATCGARDTYTTCPNNIADEHRTSSKRKSSSQESLPMTSSALIV